MVLDHDLLNGIMTLITFDDGKVVMRDNKVGTEQACCCCQSTCGEDCQQTVTVNFSVGGFDGQLVFVVADEGLGVDPMPDNYNSAGASISCSVVDGCAKWILSFTACYFDGVTTVAEQFEGLIEADSSGCPKTGNVTMTETFGEVNPHGTVTASIA